MNRFNVNELMMWQDAKFIAIVLIFLAGILVYAALSRFYSLLFKQEALSESLFRVFKNITKILVFVMVILFSMQQLGVKISAIVASLLTVSAMIAVGFIAVWSVLSNFLCSFLIILFKPFRIGDDIEITELVGGSGLRGKVVDFNIMYTSILEHGEMPEEEKALIRIPNNTFFQKATKRWKGEERKSVEKHLFNKSLINR